MPSPSSAATAGAGAAPLEALGAARKRSLSCGGGGGGDDDADDAPFRGPAADSAVGELLIDVLGIASSVGHALELAHCRALCGATWRLGKPRADGSLDASGFLGATADMMASALRLQAGARLAAARAAPRAAHRAAAFASVLPTQLMRAAFAGRAEEVRWLLAAGAEVDALNALGWTALHCAAGQGHERVARLLLEGARGAGAAVDHQNGEGATPLGRAIVNGHLAVARLLLARGACQELQDARGRTPLHEAARLNDAGAVRLLCAAPGLARAARLRCCCCRRFAESWDEPRPLRLPGAPPPSPQQCRCDGHTPLEVAAAANHAACTEAIRNAMAAVEAAGGE